MFKLIKIDIFSYYYYYYNNNMNQHTMQFIDIIKTGSLEQTQYFYSLYKQYININVCSERPFRLACCKGYVDIACWLYYNVSEMTIDITTMNHDAIHEVIINKTLILENKIKTFHFLETIYRGIKDPWFNIGRLLEYSIINESYYFAQYILQRYSSSAYDEIYGYAYNCFEHSCINGNYKFAERIRIIFELSIPDDSIVYLNPMMQEYADYILSDMMTKSFDSIKI